MRWLELNAEGVVTNIVIWDGVSLYEPEGVAQLLLCDNNVGVSVDWKLVDGVWVEPKRTSSKEDNG